MFLNTSTSNLGVVRVHAFVARELSMLQSENLSLRFPTSSVQSMHAYVENPQETTRPQASASAPRISAPSVCGRTHAENSCSTLWPYSSRVELAVSCDSATVHIAVSELSLAERTVGFGLGRTLLSLSKKRLGFVCDGDQTLPSKSSHLPRSGAAQRQREHAGLVPRLHNHSVFDTQTYSRLGLRRGFRYYQARYNPGLGRSALPFSSHQSIAELPRPTQSQTARKSAARGALPTDPPSSRACRWPSAPIRAHATQASRCAGKTIACHAHDRSRVSQTGRSFQSLSEISKIESANYYGQPRSHEPKSS